MKPSKDEFTRHIEILQSYKDQISWGTRRPQIERSIRREMHVFRPLDDTYKFDLQCRLARTGRECADLSKRF